MIFIFCLYSHEEEIWEESRRNTDRQQQQQNKVFKYSSADVHSMKDPVKIRIFLEDMIRKCMDQSQWDYCFKTCWWSVLGSTIPSLIACTQLNLGCVCSEENYSVTLLSVSLKKMWLDQQYWTCALSNLVLRSLFSDASSCKCWISWHMFWSLV